MAKEITDPVLGHLVFNTFWEGQRQTRWFGLVRLSIDTSPNEWTIADNPPSESHRQALLQFLNAERDVFDRVQQALFDLYNQVKQSAREFLTILGRPEQVPDLGNPKEIWSLLSDAGLHIPRQDDEGWRIELSWNCLWDEEHGVRMKLLNGEVDEIE